MGSGLVNGARPRCAGASPPALALHHGAPKRRWKNRGSGRLKHLFSRRGRTQHALGTSVEPVFRSTDCLVRQAVQGQILRPELSEQPVTLFDQSFLPAVVRVAEIDLLVLAQRDGSWAAHDRPRSMVSEAIGISASIPKSAATPPRLSCSQKAQPKKKL